MYGSEPRLSTVIPPLSKFNKRLKAPSLIVFKSQVSFIIMDYVFGLFLILAYLFGGKNGIPKIRCKKKGGVFKKTRFYCWIYLRFLLQFQLCFIKKHSRRRNLHFLLLVLETFSTLLRCQVDAIIFTIRIASAGLSWTCYQRLSISFLKFSNCVCFKCLL